MVVGVGHEKGVPHHGDAERVLEPRGVPAAIAVAELKQVAPGQGRHPVFGRQGNGANDVRLGVGHEQGRPIDRQAGRLGKRRVVDFPIQPRFAAGSRNASCLARSTIHT